MSPSCTLARIKHTQMLHDHSEQRQQVRKAECWVTNGVLE
jgi:hypothetical protein